MYSRRTCRVASAVRSRLAVRLSSASASRALGEGDELEATVVHQPTYPRGDRRHVKFGLRMAEQNEVFMPDEPLGRVVHHVVRQAPG